MKYLLFALLVTVPICSFSKSYSSAYLGVWKSSDGYRSIEITQEKKKIKVRESYNRKWRKYKREAYGVYEDCDGNLIKFLSPDILEWWSGNGYIPIRYYKVQRRSYEDRNHRSKNYYHRYNDNNRSNRTYLQGYWYGHNNDHQIEIKYTDWGIRVRRDNRGEWHDYQSRNGDNRSYTDRRGNRYQVQDGGHIKWYKYNNSVILSFYKR